MVVTLHMMTVKTAVILPRLLQCRSVSRRCSRRLLRLAAAVSVQEGVLTVVEPLPPHNPRCSRRQRIWAVDTADTHTIHMEGTTRPRLLPLRNLKPRAAIQQEVDGPTACPIRCKCSNSTCTLVCMASLAMPCRCKCNTR